MKKFCIFVLIATLSCIAKAQVVDESYTYDDMNKVYWREPKVSVVIDNPDEIPPLKDSDISMTVEPYGRSVVYFIKNLSDKKVYINWQTTFFSLNGKTMFCYINKYQNIKYIAKKATEVMRTEGEYGNILNVKPMKKEYAKTKTPVPFTVEVLFFVIYDDEEVKYKYVREGLYAPAPKK